MRDVNRYKAVNGKLRPDLRQWPNNTGQPLSRPVLESGTAVKTVFLSKAPKDMSQEDMNKALDWHERMMRIELQRSGRIVRKVTRTVAGIEGDARLLMTWEILGAKKTKRYRATMRANESTVGAESGSAAESGHTAPQADSKTGPL